MEYWERKFGENIDRDQRNVEALRSKGWRVMIVWECSLKKEAALDDIASEVRNWLLSSDGTHSACANLAN